MKDRKQLLSPANGKRTSVVELVVEPAGIELGRERSMLMHLSQARLDRRRFVGLTALGLAASAEQQAHADDAPTFFTERSQFVLQRPQTDVSAVRLYRPDGTTTDLANFHGKSTLLAFWASWCAPCRTELPILAELQARSSSEPFFIAPVAIDKAPATAQRFIRSLGLTSFATFVDPGASLRTEPTTHFRLYGMPMSYVVDRHSRVAGYLTGAADWGTRDALAVLRYFGRV